VPARRSLGQGAYRDIGTRGAPSWLWSPFADARWSTVLTFVALCALTAWNTRRPIVGLATAMAWLSGFEIIYEATGSIMHGWSLTTLLWTTAGTAGWMVAAYALGVRPDLRIFFVFAVLWAVWIAAGYRSNMPDRIIPGANLTFSWFDEALNICTKTTLAIGVLVGALRTRGRELPHEKAI
jgi:hypothetical protein